MLMIYGTWTTLDCPTSEVDKAEEFLKERFNAIGGNIRYMLNSHDFGEYGSFEIDYPENIAEIENLDLDDYEEKEMTQELEILFDKKEIFIKKANEIEEDYNKRFEKYL